MGEDDFISSLQALLTEPMDVVLTRNRYSILAVKKRPGGKRVARLQHVFRAMNPAEMKALARYLNKPDKRSGEKINAFLRSRQGLMENLARDPALEDRLVTKGRHRDLAAILKKVMNDHGLRVKGVKITWGARGRRSKNRSSIKFGSYYHPARAITIHPLLDNPELPEYFVEYIVYHELLHALFPPAAGSNGQREIHGPEFKRFEKKFRLFAEARKFEKHFVKTRLGKF